MGSLLDMAGWRVGAGRQLFFRVADIRQSRPPEKDYFNTRSVVFSPAANSSIRPDVFASEYFAGTPSPVTIAVYRPGGIASANLNVPSAFTLAVKTRAAARFNETSVTSPVASGLPASVTFPLTAAVLGAGFGFLSSGFLSIGFLSSGFLSSGFLSSGFFVLMAPLRYLRTFSMVS